MDQSSRVRTLWNERDSRRWSGCLSFPVVLTVLAALCCAAASMAMVAEEVTVTVTGTGSNLEAAKLDAERNAVEQAVGVVIQSYTKMEDLALVRDSVVARSAGHARWVRNVSDPKMEDGVYKLTATYAVTLVGNVIDDAAHVQALIDRFGRPRFFVEIGEQIDGRTSERGIVRNRIIDGLTQSGFRFVAARENAELLLKGSAQVRQGKKEDLPYNIGKAVEARVADIVVEIQRIDTTEIPFSSSVAYPATSFLSGEDAALEVLRKAADELYGDLKAKTIKTWLWDLDRGQMVALTVKTDSADMLQKLENALWRANGVTLVARRHFDKSACEALVEIATRFNAGQLLAEISGFQGADIEVQKSDGNTAVIVLKPGGGVVGRLQGWPPYLWAIIGAGVALVVVGAILLLRRR